MNRLLAALPDEERARLAPMIESVDLGVSEDVALANVRTRWVYFPRTALVSSVVELEAGTAEVATIGSDGVVGAELLLWDHGVPFRRFIQVPGSLDRMTSDDFMRETERGPLRRLVLCYAQALDVQTGLAAACALVHKVEHRLARWLLTVQDRLGRDRLELTQEFMGQMLGVRRASVSNVVGMLERAGFIRHRRGVVEVLDRRGLEAAACSCYGIIRDAHLRALGQSAA